MMELENKADGFIPESGHLFLLQLKNILPVNFQLSSIRAIKSSENSKQRCFSCAGSADNGNDLTFANL